MGGDDDGQRVGRLRPVGDLRGDRRPSVVGRRALEAQQIADELHREYRIVGQNRVVVVAARLADAAADKAAESGDILRIHRAGQVQPGGVITQRRIDDDAEGDGESVAEVVTD